MNRKILLIQPSLQPPGGGNAVAVQMLETLKHDYKLTVLTCEPVDIDEVNRFYGTSLTPSDFRVVMPPFLWRIFTKFDSDPYSIQQICLLMRFCKRIEHSYDMVMTGHCDMDFGRPGIQYVHCPWFHELYQQFKTIETLYGCHRLWEQFNYFSRPWHLLSGYSFDRMRNNLTLVNSDWMGGKVTQFYDIIPTTAYPPVPGGFPAIPWETRQNGFVCLGRLSGEKRYEELIAILAQVKAQEPSLHLHIIGTRRDAEYYQRLTALIHTHRSWVFLHEHLSRKEMVQLLAEHRYGIHGMLDEHFGIAVAELVRGGCITFVPDNGGQVEIIGDNHRLLYSSDEDAVSKIMHVLQNEQEQKVLRAYLEARKPLFTIERFRQQILDIVRLFLASQQEAKWNTKINS